MMLDADLTVLVESDVKRSLSKALSFHIDSISTYETHSALTTSYSALPRALSIILWVRGI